MFPSIVFISFAIVLPPRVPFPSEWMKEKGITIFLYWNISSVPPCFQVKQRGGENRDGVDPGPRVKRYSLLLSEHLVAGLTNFLFDEGPVFPAAAFQHESHDLALQLQGRIVHALGNEQDVGVIIRDKL